MRTHPIVISLCSALIVPSLACGDDGDSGTADTRADTFVDVAETIDSEVPDDTEPPEETTPAEVDPGDADPLPQDQDGDGLSDAEEQDLGTDPAAVDTDEDGYWDGWEVAAQSDPLDPLSTPALELPTGEPYILGLVDLLEPVLLRTFLGAILDRWPPILLFVDESAGGDVVTLKGGIAERVSLGADDSPGTGDDEYALELGSLDPATGDFQVALVGTREGDVITAQSDEILIDLSNISELTRGVRLRVEDVIFEATYVAGGARLEPIRLAGILSRAGVEDILENADLPLPIDADTAMEILDPDGDGIIAVDMSLEGRVAIATGWILTPDVEPVVREPGDCCPAGLGIGDPIDAALTIADQGLQPSEEAIADEVIEEALSHPELIDIVATLRVVDGERRIYVYSPRGNIYFVRERVAGETPMTVYRTWALSDRHALEGEEIEMSDERNPLANQDPSALSDYESFIAAGEPFALTDDYAALSYTEGDERLVRLPPGVHPYPFGYERLAQIFDDPRAGDLLLLEVSYRGNRGSHGHLTALQSRSPLILSGKGVIRAGMESGEGWETRCLGECGDAQIPFLIRDEAARVVDIAPTLAMAMGVEMTTGVGPDGFLSDTVYLKWQDGRPLDVALDGESPEYVLVVINDGLTSMELLHQALDPERELAGYRELMARGVTYLHGAITNYPSNTYPSHNAIGAGAYSGHHGLIDNGFYEREAASVFEPIAELFSTEKYVASAHPGLPVETLHEAVLRSFGGVWDQAENPEGVLTASLNDPSTRGAAIATLERRLPDGYVVPEAADELELGGETWTYPEADLLDAEGLLDNSTLTNAYGLFISNPDRGIPIPRYTIINLSATDGGGHAAGPHGDHERDDVIPRTGFRVQVLIEILKEAGIYDDTLIVLTADHGMELKDPNLRGFYLSGLPADIGIVHDRDFVYIKQVRVEHTPIPAAGGAVTFTVSDIDGSAPLNLLPDAVVIVESGEDELARGSTDVEGMVTLELPESGGALTVTVLKSGFSTETMLLE